ncbi:BTB/POZ and TAZ domain-containing protein 4 [Coffea eugenioides]|uniref:BTB/POZ and TAZ domain-containing protein 4 n=1 Tax=Coffea eugenioides TaxID=49369 RepID=UPI000F610727|nr:BTB/POZ and TAZ domain-containing protein 4 [Coffea eugenioides]
MESSLTSEQTAPVPLPLPPPLPYPAITSLHQKRLSPRASQNWGSCRASTAGNPALDRLFDGGYRADVLIHTDHGGVIYAHASFLGVASPVLKMILKQTKGQNRGRHRSVSIRGVPPEAVRVFIRFIYSSCYEEDKLQEHALHLLALSHAYAVPQLKQLCEWWLERRLLTTENVIDIFQLAMLCDAPRLSLICHRFILENFKPVSVTEGWKVMKESHPVLEREILESIIDEAAKQDYRVKKINERKIYEQLYEAMEAVVHIFRDGCRTIGPLDKIVLKDQSPCPYAACKGLELLVRHFAGCKRRVPGGCIHCKRLWKILELHSRICANPNICRVPLCRNFKHKRRRENKKDELKWRILVRKIVRSKSISGAPFFSLESS